MRPAALCALAAAALALISARGAAARAFRVSEIPNGAAFNCETCHETEGGVIFNPFGSDARRFLVGEGAASERSVDWSQLYALDSDGDGFTNGQELLDPNGTWRPGDPRPPGAASHPGVAGTGPSAGACGDGQLAPSETCDGAELRGATCESQNLGGGELRCGPDCRLDTSGCDGAPADEDGGDGTSADEGGCAAPAGPAGGTGGAAALLLLVGLSAVRRRARR